jgi:hypothetical protein
MKLLIAVDAKGLPQDALPRLYELVERSANEVTLLLVDEPPTEASDRYERDLRSYLESIAQRLEGVGARIAIELRFGAFEAEVREAAGRGAYDLVWTLARRGAATNASAVRRASPKVRKEQPVAGDGAATSRWEVVAA